jgi:putative ABC transport system ATP-binding protein
VSLETKFISKTYQKAHKIPALNKISLDFPPGHITALMGASGCGKSTLLKVLSLLDTVDAGEIVFENGVFDRRSTDANRARFRKENIAYVPQNYLNVPHYSVDKNIDLGLKSSPNTERHSRQEISELKQLFNLETAGRRRANQLSGGENQRLAILRALARNRPFIFIDEPSAALDEVSTVAVMQALLAQAKQGKTVVVTTHDELVQSFAQSTRNF